MTLKIGRFCPEMTIAYFAVYAFYPNASDWQIALDPFVIFILLFQPCKQRDFPTKAVPTGVDLSNPTGERGT